MSMSAQKQEFEALKSLHFAMAKVPSLHDVDFEKRMHEYETKLVEFMRACHANGRYNPQAAFGLDRAGRGKMVATG